MSYTSYMMDIYNRLFGKKIKYKLKDVFSKEPQEVKDYWKAFRRLYAKKEKLNRVEAMEAAISACPDIWQGYFLMGLVCDTCENEAIFNPEKAALYHMKAEQAVKGTDAEKWLESFYAWYRQDAQNYQIPLKPWELAVRRMGVAAMNTYKHMEPVIIGRDEKDDAFFWYGVIPSYMGMPFWSYFDTWIYFKGGRGDRDTIDMHSADLVKSYYKMCDKANKITTKINKGKSVDDYQKRDVEDMYAYVLYHSLLNPSPYQIEEGTVERGIRALVFGSNYGNATCIHELAKLVHSNEENRRFINGVYHKVIETDTRLEDFVFNCLLSSAEHGDTEAVRLLSVYYDK